MIEHSQTNIWVGDARLGDEIALSKLLAVYHPRLRARAEARMDPAVRARGGSDDILQEVYLQVFRQIGRLEIRDPNSFLNWIYTILDHMLVDAHRAAHRQIRDVARECSPDVGDSSSYWSLLDQVNADTGTPSRVIRRDEALGALLACVVKLSKDQQEVIKLRFLEGLSTTETAKRMNRGENAVTALTRRAIDSLRASMNRRGDFTRGS